MTDTPELEPCPFCGGETVEAVSEQEPFYCVCCPNCHTQGPAKPERSKAITAWNTRTTPAGDAALREAAQAVADAIEKVRGTERPSDEDFLAVWTAQDNLRAMLSSPAQPDLLAEAIERAVSERINTPETENFMKGVPLEAEHQRQRWGADHDAGKGPLDWFWLVGYLGQKAAMSEITGDHTKAKHHTISTAAALANWHNAILRSNGSKLKKGAAE